MWARNRRYDRPTNRAFRIQDRLNLANILTHRFLRCGEQSRSYRKSSGTLKFWVHLLNRAYWSASSKSQKSILLLWQIRIAQKNRSELTDILTQRFLRCGKQDRSYWKSATALQSPIHHLGKCRPIWRLRGIDTAALTSRISLSEAHWSCDHFGATFILERQAEQKLLQIHWSHPEIHGVVTIILEEGLNF